MKNALIILMVLVLLGIAGGGVYYYFSDTALPADTQNSEEFGTLFPVSGDRTLPGETEPLLGSVATTTESKTASSKAVATVPASSAFISNRGSREYVRYFESQTGHLYELGRGDALPIKLSNTTIPSIQEVLWGKDGASFVIRYQDLNTGLFTSLLGKVTFATSSISGSTNLVGEITGTNLPQTVTEIAVSPDRTKLFYLTTTSTGVEGFLTDFENKAPKKVFSSFFREWNLDWASEKALFLTSKPSNRVLGTTISFDPTTGKTSTVISNKRGLTTKSNASATALFISESTDQGFRNGTYITEDQRIDDFPLSTLPEKCTWSVLKKTVIYCATPEFIFPANYPDVWYQGLVSFDDSIWSIDTERGGAFILYDPQKQAGSSAGIDAIHLALNSTEDRLYFTDRTTGQLRFIEIPQTVVASSTSN